MNKAIVILGPLCALGAAYAMAEFVEKDWHPAPPGRLPEWGTRCGPEVGAPAPVASDPAAAPVKPGPAAVPSKPEPAKPAPAKPEPAKPAPPPLRKVADLKLVAVKNAQDPALTRSIEVHAVITPEDDYVLTWFGMDGRTTPYKDYKHLGTHLRDKNDTQFLLVPADNLPWFRIRELIKCGQDNYAAEMYLGVAKPGEAELLRVLPFRQCARSDELMPAGETFSVTLENSSGTPAISISGRKLADFPADLAAAWSDWKKAHPDLADTSVPEKTRVVFEAPRGASFSHVVQVLDVLRGIGIQTERITGATNTRPVR